MAGAMLICLFSGFFEAVAGLMPLFAAGVDSVVVALLARFVWGGFGVVALAYVLVLVVTCGGPFVRVVYWGLCFSSSVLRSLAGRLFIARVVLKWYWSAFWALSLFLSEVGMSFGAVVVLGPGLFAIVGGSPLFVRLVFLFGRMCEVVFAPGVSVLYRALFF
ncbi:hypothetical protein [Enterobacter hormaechei]|uniref:hypothetical protein n=1 Tax=Enterobacter hormaechei TaxID=158836 RepID=UPI00044884F0|nr:hypothetical protein [Enterobacter hormaechei]EUM60731.1 hypothetical protein L359_06535 [Enterobacter hormaechei subsp. hoffmannii MGH 13]